MHYDILNALERIVRFYFCIFFPCPQVQQKWPEGVPQAQNTRCVSVDGDADRVIYSFIDKNGKYSMLDGDKIATLVAGYFQELLKASGKDVVLFTFDNSPSPSPSLIFRDNLDGKPDQHLMLQPTVIGWWA